MGHKVIRSWGVSAGALLTGVALASTAHARFRDIATIALSSALSDLARQAQVELIFDPALLAGIKATRAASRSTKTALDALLAGTRFTYRQVAPRTFVIVARSARIPTTVPVAPQPSSGPEIIVVGRNSQNIDLVRGVDEVQPYWIVSGQDIIASGADSLDDYFDRYLALNRQGVPLSQQGPSPRSQIDLRGLGPDKTLVLVDGRRLASIPSREGIFEQSDINAIPAEAVDRVEVLATSAGGIFGIGATGGAINIILKRDYTGAFLSADNSVTSQGDGVQHRIYGRVGWHSPEEHTHLMVSGSYARDDGLLQGDRPFEAELRTRRVASVGYTDLVVSNSLNIQSVTGELLTFTAANGGAALGASSTYMPIGVAGLNAAGLSTLLANAGKQDQSISPDGQGALESLISSTTRASMMATLRQEIGYQSEFFLDFLRLDDRGQQRSAGFLSQIVSLNPGSSGNPFNQSIYVTFPTTIAAFTIPERDLSQRFSAGIIRHLGGWSLEADGAYDVSSFSSSTKYNFPLSGPRVFGGSDALTQDLQSLLTSLMTYNGSTYMKDANLRVTGPVAMLPGGVATLTMTGEYRHAYTHGVGSYLSNPYYSETDGGVPQSEFIWSAFGEARLPLLAEEGPPRPWRGLAGQLALRLDSYHLHIPPPSFAATDYRTSVFATTLGLQSRPTSGVILRASFSTGATPPLPSQLQTSIGTQHLVGYIDPKRGGYQSYIADYMIAVTYGDPSATPQSTETLSEGIVLEPERFAGLRMSIDYTKLITRHEIGSFGYGDIQFFLDNEALYPDRVQRAPLTSADAALGYTAGRIVALNLAALTGISKLQTLDVAVNYERGAGAGRLHLQADGDWALSYWRLTDPRAGFYNVVGYADGPLRWRVTLGAEWSTQRWSFGARTQLYAPYSLADRTPPSLSQTQLYGLSVAQLLALNALNPEVPMQAYVDLSLGFRPQGKSGMQIRATMANVFDKMPPIAATTTPTVTGMITTATTSGTANFGDLRGRRFALNVSVPLGS